ncbi:hypothetical protein [Nannocystis punicea]|uniref:Uncharacterized protein n=1 Tax=Nannocystis punicea TaxID=2995304 RepID=A0ABY7GV81_9BACT|nr:hypothetical protein [Nannocystis poenicansa]WAS90814.1 hypothetical protein O0S08_31890 [Nannocystis poenicansa]
MHTSHVDHSTRPAAASILSSLLLGAALTVLGCGGGGKSDKTEQSPADQFCGSLSEYVHACAAAATPCDEAMIADCASVVGLVSDGFLRSASDCIQAGGSPFSCLAGAIGGLAPSPAHEAFVAQFCDECAFGVGGCEDVLLGRSEGPPELAVASALVLPLGDSLVDALRAECATGLGCLATFPNCAQKVLAQQVIPEQTLQCLLDSLSGKAPAAPPVSEDSASACGLSGGETMGLPGWTTAGTAGASASEATTTNETGETTAGTSSTGGDPGTTQSETTDVSTSTTDVDVSTSGSTTTTGDNPDMGATTDGWDQLCAGPFSEHTECDVGGPLPEECTWCTDLVCNYIDAFCCDSQWDDMCQAHAKERCSMSCWAGIGLCTHSPCEAGAALTRSCSDCVLAVCHSKPSCCDVAWDDECASMASACGIC